MTDWDRMAGPAIAAHTGPFPERSFLETAARHWSEPVEVIGAGDAAMAITEAGGVARFVGAQHLTDYHSPLGTTMDELAAAVLEFGVVRLELDSLPAEAADPLAAGFAAAGAEVAIAADEQSCQVLDLSTADPEAWEANLAGKQRHEVRRKRRRFEEAHGPPQLASESGLFDDFVRLHRMAAGDKGGFMTDAMESFFADLSSLPGSRVDALTDGDTVLAAAFGFEDDDAYYLYNSAFRPELAASSPGIVLADQMIAASVAAMRSRFDFLKGDEVYKRRLGAQPRRLMRLVVTA